MLKKRVSKSVLAVVLALPLGASAANLVDVLQDALANDPTYKAAQAQFEATKESVPISVASFLPQVSVFGKTQRDRNDIRSGPPVTVEKVFNNDQASYGINLNQSLFNYSNWATLANAQAQTKQQCAALSAAYQDLLFRTATAYFDVMRASETLRFTQAEKKAIGRQLQQNRERYKVGLIAITAVYETQASYDTAVAREVAAQNAFAGNIEKLREITGKQYQSLQGIEDRIPLNPPRPANIESWVRVAERQNYALKAASYGVQAAKENIKLAFSGHLPVLSGFAGWNYSFQSDAFGAASERVNKQTTAGLDASLPIFLGGSVSAQTRQARYVYQQLVSERERAHRQIASVTRQSYLGIISGISQVHADKQTILSRENALKATEAAYEVGTRTMVDVLDAQSRLYNAQEIHAKDQYGFLLSTLALEQAAGTLCPDDLTRINRWLRKRVAMIPYSSIGKVGRISGPRPENIKPTDLSNLDDTKPLPAKEKPAAPITAPKPSKIQKKSDSQDT